ncbi:MAG: hypothetical protein Q8K63_14785 [Acidimicrobiales bacterium]|nr:hypothetical protein [Acidimicrobiales bacterium]
MNRDLATRFAQLFVGLAGVGLGVALMVDAGVGLSPWDVLHQGLSEQTGYAIGTVAIALGTVIFLTWIPLKQRIGVGTVINVLTIGLAVNAFLNVEFAPAGVSRYVWSVVGVVIISASGGIYIGAGLGTGPRDGVMTGLVAKGYPLRTVRTLIELSVLVIGWLLGGTIGFGTVLFAVTVGPILHFVLHKADRGPYRRGVVALDDHDDAFPPPAVS